MNFKDVVGKIFSKQIFGGKHTSENSLDEAVDSMTNKKIIHKHDSMTFNCKDCVFCNYDADCVEDEDGCYDVIEICECELECPEFDYKNGCCGYFM